MYKGGKEKVEHLRKIARLGALARMKKYGNPGTLGGRKRGGFNSLKTHRKNRTGFVFAKKCRYPRKSGDLAEFLGVLVGDGHLSDYQVLIVTNSETDMEHALFLANLIKKLFNVEVVVRIKKNERAVTIVASSVKLVNWLTKLGMPVGNKLSHGLFVPKWIMQRKSWQKRFIRGLFDTDGCVYLDHHKIRGRLYENMGWTITSYSAKLKNDIFAILRGFGFSPSMRDSQSSVYLRKKIDIDRYFGEIGSSNSKHIKRYQQFQGRVPKWS